MEMQQQKRRTVSSDRAELAAIFGLTLDDIPPGTSIQTAAMVKESGDATTITACQKVDDPHWFGVLVVNHAKPSDEPRPMIALSGNRGFESPGAAIEDFRGRLPVAWQRFAVLVPSVPEFTLQEQRIAELCRVAFIYRCEQFVAEHKVRGTSSRQVAEKMKADYRFGLSTRDTPLCSFYMKSDPCLSLGDEIREIARSVVRGVDRENLLKIRYSWQSFS